MHHPLIHKHSIYSVQSGPVSGSIFVENCADCSFVVACQQLRVHSTSSSHFYLHVTSRAVIEDSRQLAFAPYSRTYPELLADYEVGIIIMSTRTSRGGKLRVGPLSLQWR